MVYTKKKNAMSIHTIDKQQLFLTGKLHNTRVSSSGQGYRKQYIERKRGRERETACTHMATGN